MNILVTGASGQLGRSIESLAGSRPADSFFFTDLPEADITDRSLMEALVRRTEAGAIINCAAYTAVDRAESEPGLCARINADGPAVLATTALKYDIPLIHISTDYVFDGLTPCPLCEDDPVGPQGVYGRTKLDGETAVRQSGCRAAVIRTSWLYSRYGKNFVKTMLALGRERGAVEVVYDQTGTPTYAPDLAVAALALLDRGVEGFEIYHYSNEGVTSWYDFARKIFQFAGLPVEVTAIESDRYPTAAVRPPYSVLNKRKVKESGIPVPHWEESLARCIGELECEQKNDPK